MSNDTDFIGFTYGGIHSSTYGLVRVSSSNRYEEQLIPQFNEEKTVVPGGDGTYLFGANYTQRQIKVSFAFDNLSETNYRQLRLWLNNKDSFKQLIFDERPYKYYMAKPSAPPTLKTLCFTENYIEDNTTKTRRIYKGEGDVTFVCYYPFARSVYKYLNQYKAPETILNLAAYGQAASTDTFDQFRIDITDTSLDNEDGTYFYDSNSDKWYLLGSSPLRELQYNNTFNVSNPQCGNSLWSKHYNLVQNQRMTYNNTKVKFFKLVKASYINQGYKKPCFQYILDGSIKSSPAFYYFKGDGIYAPDDDYTKLTSDLINIEYTNIIIKDNASPANIYQSGSIFKQKPEFGDKEYQYNKVLDPFLIYENTYSYDINFGSRNYPISILDDLTPYDTSSSQMLEWEGSTQMYDTKDTEVGNIILDTLYNDSTNHTSKIYLYNPGDFSTYFQLLFKVVPTRVSLVVPYSSPIIIAEFNNEAILPENNALLIDTKTQLIQMGYGSITNFTSLQMVNNWAPIQNCITIPIISEKYSSVDEMPYIFIEWDENTTLTSNICEIQYDYLYF